MDEEPCCAGRHARSSSLYYTMVGRAVSPTCRGYGSAGCPTRRAQWGTWAHHSKIPLGPEKSPLAIPTGAPKRPSGVFEWCEKVPHSGHPAEPYPRQVGETALPTQERHPQLYMTPRVSWGLSVRIEIHVGPEHVTNRSCSGTLVLVLGIWW